MPTIRNYSAGSIVYFQDDRGDDIFVLQKGTVVLISTVPGEQEERKSPLKLGEFFGVKSGLGHYPREETAQALSQTQLVVFEADEFQNYALRNIHLIVKMLTIFSHELRDIHHKTRTLLKKESEMDSAFELLRVAEDFYRNHNLEYACYAFECFLKHYGDSKNSSRAKDLLKLAQQGVVYPVAYPPLNPELDASQKQKERDVQRPQEKQQGIVVDSAIRKLFSAAKADAQKGNSKDAIARFQKCLTLKDNLKTQEEKDIYERSYLELSVHLTKNKQYQEATRYLSHYIKNYPTGNYMRDSLYQFGLIYELEGHLDKARALYHKLATMRPHDVITSAAREKLQKIN